MRRAFHVALGEWGMCWGVPEEAAEGLEEARNAPQLREVRRHKELRVVANADQKCRHEEEESDDRSDLLRPLPVEA